MPPPPEEEPLTKVYAFPGSKVMKESAGVNKGQMLRSALSRATKFCRTQEPLTEVGPYCALIIDEAKGYAGVSWGQTGVKLRRNVLWLPNLVEGNPDRKPGPESNAYRCSCFD